MWGSPLLPALYGGGSGSGGGLCGCCVLDGSEAGSRWRCDMKPSLWEKTINIYVSSISKTGEAQRARRLVFANAFSIDEVSQGIFFCEPTDGVLRVYLSYFCMLLDLVVSRYGPRTLTR